MAKQYTKSYSPNVAADVSDWTNETNVFSKDVNTFAKSSSLTAIVDFSYFYVGWKPTVFSSIPNDATINNIKIELVARVSKQGTGDWFEMSYGYNVPATGTSFSDDILTYKNERPANDQNSDFGTSFTSVPHNLAKKPTVSQLKNGGLFTKHSLAQNRAFVSQEVHIAYFLLTVDYTVPEYTITINNSVGGTATGMGTYESGAKATLTATANPGYKFTAWSDGNQENPRIITVNGNASYTPVFEPVSYVTYDSIFNFQKWKNEGITSGMNVNISNISNTGFTMTITDSNDPMTNTTPTMSVVAGQRYVLEFDTDIADAFQPFIFYCINENNNSWTQAGGGGTHTDGTPTYNQKRIEFTPTTNWISLRFDIDGSVGRSGHFSNFRIYPAGHDYMSTTVAAEDRTDFGSWSMTTPIRTGYRFLGWYTQPNGGGTKYTSSSAFPTTETILYSHWEIAKYTITFKNQDGTTIKSSTVQSGTSLGTLPAVSREGYTFAGWIPCAPAVKTDGSVLDSYLYDGNTAYPLDTKYKYTNNLSIHIEAYMEDWVDIKSRQIMSCTEGGGWGLGYQANTKVNNVESHGFEVHTGSGYTGYDLKFGTEGMYTNNKWHSFDIVFSNGVIEIFVDGVSKGSRTASGSSISYNSSNTIFVGAEAGTSTSSPGGNYFKGLISNVFIANQGTRLIVETGTSSNTAITESVDYYPIWRLNSEQKKNQIYIGDKLIKEIYIGTNKVKEVYIGTTKIYG